jgi:acetyl-CoA acetyltransferase
MESEQLCQVWQTPARGGHSRQRPNAAGQVSGRTVVLTAAELGRIVVKAAVQRSGVDAAELNEVILGNVVSAGVGRHCRAR